MCLFVKSGYSIDSASEKRPSVDGFVVGWWRSYSNSLFMDSSNMIHLISLYLFAQRLRKLDFSQIKEILQENSDLMHKDNRLLWAQRKERWEIYKKKKPALLSWETKVPDKQMYLECWSQSQQSSSFDGCSGLMPCSFYFAHKSSRDLLKCRF